MLEVRYLAQQQGKTVTAVIQEALAEYVAAHRQPRQISIIGIGESDEDDISERDEEILRAEIAPLGGWTRRRHPGGKADAGATRHNRQQ